MRDQVNKLIQAANSAKKNAYSQYSRFNVGAAIQSERGEMFTGCNIENASYGISICAERVALFKAVSEGHRSFDSLAICSSGVRTALPCGACRQALYEFSPNLKIYLDNQNNSYNLSSLLSHPFSRDQMILNKTDRTILGTRYFASICEKTKKSGGRRARFSKTEIYGTQLLDAYNREIVIPMIIEKLKGLGYIYENKNNKISLTTLGKRHCGQKVTLDPII
jgi:cytidine deaminase